MDRTGENRLVRWTTALAKVTSSSCLLWDTHNSCSMVSNIKHQNDKVFKVKEEFMSALFRQ